MNGLVTILPARNDSNRSCDTEFQVLIGSDAENIHIVPALLFFRYFSSPSYYFAGRGGGTIVIVQYGGGICCIFPNEITMFRTFSSFEDLNYS